VNALVCYSEPVAGRISTADISVLTPSYGYGRFIRDAILSSLRQADVRVEHIVQDACSSDGTVEILEEFDGLIRWRSEPDLGQSDALNRALADATAPWIGWLNADEFYVPNALAVLKDIGERRAADVVYGDAVFVDVEGRLLRLLPQHGPHHTTLRWYGPYISSCAAIFRRSCLGDRPWDISLKRTMDWELYLRLSSQGARFVYVPYPVGVFRVHPDRVTARKIITHESKLPSLQSQRVGSPQLRHFALARAGRILHRAQKLMAGSYWRQVRAHALGGYDVRWFQSEMGVESCNALLARCYPRAAQFEGEDASKRWP
jgi:glycosyltransferase involved in cell wall biosynthesis